MTLASAAAAVARMDVEGERVLVGTGSRSGGDEEKVLAEYEAQLVLLEQVLQNYFQCLAQGNAFIFQALPRLLTLWFRFGEEHPQWLRLFSAPSAQRQRAQADQRLKHCVAAVEDLMPRVAPYQWLTALAQARNVQYVVRAS